MSSYDELVAFVAEQGISEQEAQHAVNHCLRTMAATGAATYAGAGLIAFFMKATPASAAGSTVLLFGGGAAYALAKSPNCSEVRQAIKYWNSAHF